MPLPTAPGDLAGWGMPDAAELLRPAWPRLEPEEIVAVRRGLGLDDREHLQPLAPIRLPIG
jgi:hypothetical protein